MTSKISKTTQIYANFNTIKLAPSFLQLSSGKRHFQNQIFIQRPHNNFSFSAYFVFCYLITFFYISNFYSIIKLKFPKTFSFLKIIFSVSLNLINFNMNVKVIIFTDIQNF